MEWVVVSAVIILVLAVIVLSAQNTRLKGEIETTRQKAQSEVNSAYQQLENEKKALAAKYQSDVAIVRQDCAKQVRQAQEEIESRIDVLSKMDDKEILVSAMVALDGYARRFERLEKKLSDDQITQKIANMANALTKRIDEMTVSFEQSLNKFELGGKIDSMSSDIDDISDEIQAIRQNMYYDDGSLNGKLTSIENAVGEIHASISDRYSYDSLAYDIGNIMDAVESLKENAGII